MDRTLRLLALFLLVAAAGCITADDTGDAGDEPEAVAHLAGGFDVAFTSCVESIGVTLVPTAPAQALVPAGIIPVGAGTPVTPLVVRTARCRIAVDGHPARTGAIVQVGLVIVPPGVPGDIDNYTLGYVTNDPRLALALHRVGVDARLRQIDYDVAASGAFAVSIGEFGRFDLAGTVTPSSAPAGAFHANWWRADDDGDLIEMATTVPVIAIGGADLVLSTNYDPLVALLGAETTGFPIIQQFNSFAAATMAVTRP